jgi:hypothetical protein
MPSVQIKIQSQTLVIRSNIDSKLKKINKILLMNKKWKLLYKNKNDSLPKGAFRESNSGPLAPKARIIPLDQMPTLLIITEENINSCNIRHSVCNLQNIKLNKCQEEVGTQTLTPKRKNVGSSVLLHWTWYNDDATSRVQCQAKSSPIKNL